MSKYNYSRKDIGENAAKAVGVGLNISTKQSIEVCKHIRGRSTTAAKKILNEAIALKKAIPFTRFTNGVGHRRGDIGSGSYAPKTCGEILKLVESAEANAQYKGLNSSNLFLIHVSAQQGPGQWRYGRKRRQRMKSTHIEIVVEEKAVPKKDTKKAGKEVKNAEPVSKEVKAETKKTAPVAEKKPTAKPAIKEEKKVEVKTAPVGKKVEEKPVEKKAEPVKATPVAKEEKVEAKQEAKPKEGNDQK